MRLRAGVALATVAAVAALLVACSGTAKRSASTTPGDATAASDATTAASIPSSAAPAGHATFKVLAGHSEGAFDIEMYMPADVRIRQGDTIEWTAQGFEGHTITFATPRQLTQVFQNYLLDDPADPQQKIFNSDAAYRSAAQDIFAGDGTYTNSGFIGVPNAATYRLTFTKPGTYQYVCLVHPFTMRGTVSVDAPDAAVDSPETVESRGQADLARYLDIEQRALKDAGDTARVAPAPAGATIHHVAVGLTTNVGQVATYVRPTLDIKTGDTVIFENDDRDFHNVIFKGANELPPGIKVVADPGGRGINYIIAKESAIAVDPPPSGFDPGTFLSSGSLGVLQPRLTWTLRFDTPGTYQYACTIHALAGMAGVITVH